MNLSIQLKSLLATVIASAILVPTSEALAVRRFLKAPADSSIVFQYGQAMPTAFDRDVNSSIGKCGTIKFDYDTYSKKPNGIVSGGAALAGGFFLNSSKCMVLNGFDLHWVQTVTATITGRNDWMLPQMEAGEFPDSTPASPIYPFETVPTSPPGMTPTLGFQDFPERNFADGTQSWLAELGLVAISQTPNIEMEMDGVKMMFREVRVLDTLLWGFNFNNPTVPFSVTSVTPNSPSFWGDPTQSYLNTLNQFYDGLGGNGKVTEKFKFSSNDNVFKPVPEPSSILGISAIGGLGLLGLRKKRQ